jgi:hypothetical protein
MDTYADGTADVAEQGTHEVFWGCRHGLCSVNASVVKRKLLQLSRG